jgi:hypothetical protein
MRTDRKIFGESWPLSGLMRAKEIEYVAFADVLTEKTLNLSVPLSLSHSAVYPKSLTLNSLFIFGRFM